MSNGYLCEFNENKNKNKENNKKKLSKKNKMSFDNHNRLFTLFSFTVHAIEKKSFMHRQMNK